MVNQSRRIVFFLCFLECFQILIVKIPVNRDGHLIARPDRIKSSICRSVQILLQNRSITVNQDNRKIITILQFCILMGIVSGFDNGKFRFVYSGSRQILIVGTSILYGISNCIRFYRITMQPICNSKDFL